MCSAAFSSRITKDSFGQETIMSHNRVITYLNRSRNTKLSFPRLELAELFVNAFAYSTFGNNELYS